MDIAPPRYWQAMCGFIKGMKSLSVNSEQHDPSPTFNFASYQGRTISDNAPDPEE